MHSVFRGRGKKSRSVPNMKRYPELTVSGGTATKQFGITYVKL